MTPTEDNVRYTLRLGLLPSGWVAIRCWTQGRMDVNVGINHRRFSDTR